MSPVLAIMRKDVIRMAGPLTIWGLAGLHMLWPHKRSALPSGMFSETQALSMLAFLMFSVVMIAWVIQEDNARDAEAFWRSRPISPQVLLGAKLTLLVFLLVALPTAGVLVGEALNPGFFRRIDRLPNVMGFMLCSVIACSALAACTRNLGEYLLLGAVAGLFAGSLGSALETLSPIDPHSAFRLSSSQLFVSMALCGVGGLTTLLVQYRMRRVILSIGVVATTLVSIAVTDAFWAWRIQ